MSKILVTGGTGFVGTHLLSALLKRGEAEIHATTFRRDLSTLRTELPSENIHQIDLTDKGAVFALIEKLKPDKIYHLAAFSFVSKSFNQASEVFNNNVTLQINILEAVKEFVPSCRLLIVGSAEEYGVSESPDELPINEDHPLRPINPYAVSKVTQDLLAYSYGRSFNLQIFRVRPFNHLGVGQTTEFVVPSFITQIVEVERGKREQLEVGNLSSIRDFSDVKDVVLAYITVMERGVPLEVYNIGSGVGVRISDLLEMMKSLAGVEIKIKRDERRMRPADIPEMVADITKIKKLGWSPQISLEATLGRIFEFVRRESA